MSLSSGAMTASDPPRIELDFTFSALAPRLLRERDPPVTFEVPAGLDPEVLEAARRSWEERTRSEYVGVRMAWASRPRCS